MPRLSQGTHQQARGNSIIGAAKAGQPKGSNTLCSFHSNQQWTLKTKNPLIINQTVTFPQKTLYPPTIYGLSHRNIGCQAKVFQPQGHFRHCRAQISSNMHELGKYLRASVLHSGKSISQRNTCRGHNDKTDNFMF